MLNQLAIEVAAVCDHRELGERERALRVLQQPPVDVGVDVGLADTDSPEGGVQAGNSVEGGRRVDIAHAELQLFDAGTAGDSGLDAYESSQWMIAGRMERYLQSKM